MRERIEPLTIGMPQLGPYGLSETSLLKEAGHRHWTMIARALGKRSRDIVDAAGNRLYASFARVCWTSTQPLAWYRESDQLEGCAQIARCGDGVFVSAAQLTSGDKAEITIKMASIFTRREWQESNDRLLASAPEVPADCQIPDIELLPAFLIEHRLLRTGKMERHTFMGVQYDVKSPPAEETIYELTGFHEFNGANLLYFCAYPAIADVGESRSRFVAENMGRPNFITQCSPSGRDIFYLGNANLCDVIVCGYQHIRSANARATRVSLGRNAAANCISQQFVVRHPA
jgi:probable biosynthetic protein (TIGR04098 family)